MSKHRHPIMRMAIGFALDRFGLYLIRFGIRVLVRAQRFYPNSLSELLILYLMKAFVLAAQHHMEQEEKKRKPNVQQEDAQAL